MANLTSSSLRIVLAYDHAVNFLIQRLGRLDYFLVSGKSDQIREERHGDDTGRKCNVLVDFERAGGVGCTHRHPTNNQKKCRIENELNDVLSRKIGIISHKNRKQSVNDPPKSQGGDSG